MLSANKDETRRLLGIEDNKTVILSAGGSLGAKMINESVHYLIKNYTSCTDKVRHFHATGRGGYDEQALLYRSEGFTEADSETLKKGGVTVKKYIYNMPELLAAADIVICRAGAMTLSEIACMGKASIIVPSPNVTNNHQYKNAKVLADAGAAVLIEEKDLTGQLLCEKVKYFVDNPEERKKMQDNVRKFAVMDALDRIYSEICELAD